MPIQGVSPQIKESTELAEPNLFSKESIKNKKQIFKYVEMADFLAIGSISRPKIEGNIIFSSKI